MYNSNTTRRELHILCCLNTRPQNRGIGGGAYSRGGGGLFKFWPIAGALNRRGRGGEKLIRGFKAIDNYKCEDYLHQVTNTRHRIALTKLRLSNHKLAIETGRYSRPFKKPAERTCPICKIEMEDEYHFLNIRPAYQEKRCSLLDYLEKEYRIKVSRMSPNRIFMFLINPPSGNVRIQKLIAKHV